MSWEMLQNRNRKTAWCLFLHSEVIVDRIISSLSRALRSWVHWRLYKSPWIYIYGSTTAKFLQWAKCIIIQPVKHISISIFRRLYCTAPVAVHKLIGEHSVRFRKLCREGVMGCLLRHCSNITVINAAFHPSQRRKVLKLPLVLLLMHQPVWPNCSSYQAWKLFTQRVIKYPISLSWNRNCIRAFNV